MSGSDRAGFGFPPPPRRRPFQLFCKLVSRSAAGDIGGCRAAAVTCSTCCQLARVGSLHGATAGESVLWHETTNADQSNN
eukprot:7428288-Lingulodinium_polyedra.AAC.1